MAFGMRIRRRLGITGCLLGGFGGFCVFNILEVTLHEVVGHGLIAVGCGGRFEAFPISLDFSAWARLFGVVALRLDEVGINPG